MSDFDFDLSRSLKVKSDGALGPPIYNFPVVLKSKHMCTSYHLGVIATKKNFSYLLSLRPNFDQFNIFGDILLTVTDTHRDKCKVRNPARQSMGGV